MDTSKKISIYSFTDKVIFTEALTHTSYCYENPMSGRHNERLEFLGDSILSCVVTDYIYGRFPYYKEGTLTQLRARIVCQSTLAVFAKNLGLDKKLRLGVGSSSMRDSEKLLCDAFEAYIGAVFLDSKRDLTKLWSHIAPLVEPFVDYLKETNACGINDNDDGTISIEDEEEKDPVEKPVIPPTHAYEDPIGKLQMWVVRTISKKVLPLYSEKKDSDGNFTCEVTINGHVVGQGEGPNKKTAKKQAAENALKNESVLKKLIPKNRGASENSVENGGASENSVENEGASENSVENPVEGPTS